MHLIGYKAPLFDAPAYSKQKGIYSISLESLKGRWVFLLFYPADFSRVCPTELLELDKLSAELEQLNCLPLAVSVDSELSHKNWLEKDLPNLNLTLVSDLTKRISRDFGVLEEESGKALRGSVFIDPEGFVQFQSVQPFRIARNFKEVIPSLKALQNEGLCYANWKHES